MGYESFLNILQGLTPRHQEKTLQGEEGLTVFGMEHFGTIHHHPQDTKSRGEGSITHSEELTADILKLKEIRKPWPSSRSNVNTD